MSSDNLYSKNIRNHDGHENLAFQSQNEIYKKSNSEDRLQNGKDVILNGDFIESKNGNMLQTEFIDKGDQTITENNRKKKPETVSYFKLFRFATSFELFLLVIGLICATIGSIGVPYNVVIFGEFTAILVDRASEIGTSTQTILLQLFGGGRILTNASKEERLDALLEDSTAFGIGCAVGATMQFIFCALSVDILNHVALKSICRIRLRFLDSILRQDMIYYDTSANSENFAVKITDDLDKLKEGIGEKLAICINLIMAFVISVIFALFYGWKLTLVMLTCAPIIVLSTAFVARVQSSLTEKELKSYSKAGAVAEEVLGSIRTVAAFSGEEKEINRYQVSLEPSVVNGKRKGLFSGIGNGIMWLIIYCIYALAFWYGVKLILESRLIDSKEYTAAVLIIVLFGVLEGAQNLGLTSPLLEAFATAKGSAFSIFRLIDRIPTIDCLSQEGLRPENIEGNIKLTNVTFKYPARQDVQVLDGLNLEIKAGQTTALVGASGCGKSTVLQLIQRLYDPLDGTVEIDGIKVQDFNVQCIRSFIGVVGQEPVLFATTIRENIRYGRPDCTDEEIEKAAKIANCHGFILKLPEGYETLIGERGASLSGGQKQRIAIARAVVRNPRILILDEATSALDPTSEKRVQNALERASEGRTTLVVSHRLSTIFNADKIVVVNKGVVIEQGTHAELMDKQGMYHALVNANNTSLSKKTDTPKQKRHKMKRKESIKSLTSDESEESEIECTAESESDEESIDEVKKIKDKTKVSTYRLLKMNSPEWVYILFGCIGAITVGASFPTYAVLFGQMFEILPYTDVNYIQERADYYAILFLVLGFVTAIAAFLQTYAFSIAGVFLTSRLRHLTFKAMVNQDIGWFDDAKNGIGALCARLSGDCANVQGATGSKVGAMLQAGSVIFIGIGISLFFSWKMTLVASVFIPPIFICVYLEAVYMEASNIKERSALENATKLAVEAIANIRTVNSLCQEKFVIERYTEEMNKVRNYNRKKSLLRGLIFGLGKSIPNYGYALALWYGGTLIVNEGVPYKNVIIVGEALIWGSLLLGQALAFAPNVNSAVLSASRIVNLLDRKPKIKEGKKLPDDTYNKSNGDISYKNVEFCYPTRKNITVLDEFNLDIKTGQTVALVGQSGCGKSTCMQLLLRYYDPDSGDVEFDGTSSIDFPLDKIRSHLGLVSQEPILFDRTIAENIAYGDNSRTIPLAEIIEAAKSANIHEFISGLPKGYETGLGNKGAQLSGGQKQRIAIARALVRNPKILLLDEATSALDTHSEKVVQAALDKARTGRTCIMIAHRLTTIHNADLICVVEGGEVVEKGTHDQLMKLGKKYAKLYVMQQVE